MFSAPASPIRRLHWSHAQLACALILSCIFGATVVGCGTNEKPKKIQPRYATLPPKEVPEFLKGTIFERVDAANTEPLNVNDFSVVANLPDRTGDSKAPIAVREYIIKQMVKNGIGSSRTVGMEGVTPEEMLRDPRTAIVRVDGFIPAGARKGQRIDAAISALDFNDTSSLRGGELYRTDLKTNGADPRSPGVAIDIQAVCQGPIFVNPVYALGDPKDTTVKNSLRYGVVLGGGIVSQDRALRLRIRAPQLAVSRQIEWRIDSHFQDQTVAAAYDEGFVQLYVPAYYNGDWEHFLNVAMHLYFNQSAEFAAAKARELAAEAVKPNAPLENISFAWEGLGTHALPHIIPLMNSNVPEVQFAATRAAAFIGDSSALTVLGQIAATANHPFQLPAVQVLGAQQPRSTVINQILRGLLNSNDSTVRIEAYRLLTDVGDQSIYAQSINGKFFLDIVRSGGPPLIYASRRGTPRIAIFGGTPMLSLPASFAALDNRLTISGGSGDRAVKIFYRDPAVARPAPVLSNPDIAEIIARLGGVGSQESPQKLNFGYSDVVAIVQSMTQNNQVYAAANGARHDTMFVLQPLPRVQDEIQSAPPIPDRPTDEHGRPQGDGQQTSQVVPPDSGTSRAEARK